MNCCTHHTVIDSWTSRTCNKPHSVGHARPTCKTDMPDTPDDQTAEKPVNLVNLNDFAEVLNLINLFLKLNYFLIPY